MLLERKGVSEVLRVCFSFCCQLLGLDVGRRRLIQGRLSVLGGFRWWVFLSCCDGKYSNCWVGSCQLEEAFSGMVSPLCYLLPAPLVLQGQWIERDHCTITSTCGVVILRPTQGARCTVNGREVTASCRLTQGRTVYLPVSKELNKASFSHVLLSLYTQRPEDFLI